MTTKLNLIALATACCALLLAPIASADDVGEADLIQQLEQRLLAAEDKLEESESTIQLQRDLLKNSSAPAVNQGSALDSFFSKLEVGGHVTGSYTYSFEKPSLNVLTPAVAVPTPVTQPGNQFNLNHNTFQFDAAKLELGKPTEGPGTGGFQLDILFGANSQTLGAGLQANDTDVFIQEAYAAYNWNGFDLKFGKFETLLGYEVLDSPYNDHVTHGLLFTFAIPLFHTGLLASGEINEGMGWSFGVTNGFNNVTDTNDNKGLLGQLRFASGAMNASLNGYYGADLPDQDFVPAVANASVRRHENDKQLILDFVGTFQASDTMKLWVNADWGEQEDLFTTGGDFEDVQWWGVAAGTALQLSDKMDFALRGEYFNDENAYRLPIAANTSEVKAISLTGTLGYALTENLTTRLELRFDRFDTSGPTDQIIPGGTCVPFACISLEEDAYTGYLEVSYSFD